MTRCPDCQGVVLELEDRYGCPLTLEPGHDPTLGRFIVEGSRALVVDWWDRPVVRAKGTALLVPHAERCTVALEEAS